MKVYLVRIWSGQGPGDYTVYGVFSSRERAEEAAHRMLRTERYSTVDDIEIQEYELDEVIDYGDAESTERGATDDT